MIVTLLEKRLKCSVLQVTFDYMTEILALEKESLPADHIPYESKFQLQKEHEVPRVNNIPMQYFVGGSGVAITSHFYQRLVLGVPFQVFIMRLCQLPDICCSATFTDASILQAFSNYFLQPDARKSVMERVVAMKKAAGCPDFKDANVSVAPLPAPVPTCPQPTKKARQAVAQPKARSSTKKSKTPMPDDSMAATFQKTLDVAYRRV